MSKPEAKVSQDTANHAPKRSLLRKASTAVLVFAVIVFFLPWIIAGTPLRNVLVNMALNDQDVQANVGSASIGWFSPLALEDLKINIHRGETVLTVAGVQADHSWLDILMDRPDLGHFDIERPSIDVLITARQEEETEGSESDSSVAPSTTLSVAVHDGAFTLRTHDDDEPIMEILGFDATVHLVRGKKGRTLTIEPGRLLDHQKLTREMCSRGFHLIAPVLGDSALASGEISLELTKFELPLDLPQGKRPLEEADIQGSLHLHSVETGLKSPLLLNIARVIATLLQKDVPATMRVADDAKVLFQVNKGRIHHQGLAFGLPELSADMVIRTEGSVGIDRTLDLKVTIPLPLNLVFDGPLADRLSEKPLRLHVTGTLDQPKTQLLGDEGGMQGLIAGILSSANNAADPDNPDQPLGEPDEIVGGALELIQGVIEARRKRNGETPEGEAGKPLNLLDRIRKRREEIPR